MIQCDNKILQNPTNFVINKMYNICELGNDAEFMMIIMNSAIHLTLDDIIVFTNACTSHIVVEFLKDNISKAATRAVHALSDNTHKFNANDYMTYLFGRRKWPVSAHSSKEWRDAQMSKGFDTNWMIITIKTMLSTQELLKTNNDGNLEMPYSDVISYNVKDDIVNLDDEMETAISKGQVNKFSTLALKQDNSFVVEQYLMWIGSVELPEKFHIIVTKFGAHFMKNKRPRGVGASQQYLKMYDRPATNIFKHVATLHLMRNANMIDEFMVYACTMLSLPNYLLLLREVDIMNAISLYMKKRPVYTDMVGVAMSYAMYYATRYEFDTTSFDAMVDDPYVWTLKMMAAFPSFDATPGSGPYIQMGVKNMKLFTPWMVIDSARHIVKTKNAKTRMTMTCCRESSGLCFVKIIPWGALKLAFTGSRLGSCCFILPHETLFPNFYTYISEYVGTCEVEIDAAINEYNCTYNSEIEVPIVGINANITIANVFAACQKKSDIDIQYRGHIDDFDKAANHLVIALREHGTVFMVRRKKYGASYSWTIFASYLRYPIDLFCAPRSPIRLIVGFMTGYPRIYYDGAKIIGTSYYFVARKTGINIWYEKMRLNSPVTILVKSAIQEQCTILINYAECRALEEWRGIRGESPPIFGNMSIKNSFFWKGKKNPPKPIDSERHWLKSKWMIPLSGDVMKIWNDKCEFIIPTNNIFDGYASALVTIKNQKKM
jgi:hypothetical protein